MKEKPVPVVIAATIIDGNGNDGVVKCINNETSNTVLAGFTVIGMADKKN